MRPDLGPRADSLPSARPGLCPSRLAGRRLPRRPALLRLLLLRMAQKENAYPWPYGSQTVRSWPHSSPHLPEGRPLESDAGPCGCPSSERFRRVPREVAGRAPSDRLQPCGLRCGRPAEPEGFCRAEPACHRPIITGTERAAALCFQTMNPTL